MRRLGAWLLARCDRRLDWACRAPVAPPRAPACVRGADGAAAGHTGRRRRPPGCRRPSRRRSCRLPAPSNCHPAGTPRRQEEQDDDQQRRWGPSALALGGSGSSARAAGRRLPSGRRRCIWAAPAGARQNAGRHGSLPCRLLLRMAAAAAAATAAARVPQAAAAATICLVSSGRKRGSCGGDR